MNPQKTSFGRWQRSLAIIKGSWRIFRLEPKLLIIEALSFLIVGLAIGLLIALSIHWGIYKSTHQPIVNTVQWLGIGLAFYLITATFYSFGMGWFAHIIYQRLSGHPTSLRRSWQAVRPRWQQLLLYGLMNGLITFGFESLREKVPFLGKIAVLLGQIAWSVANIFAIPIIVTSQKPTNPIAAVKQSAQLIRQTWGEGVISQFGIGLVGIVIFMISVLLSAASLVLSNVHPAAIIGSVLLILGVAIFLSLIASIAQVVLFYYAKTGQAPEAFNQELLRQAMTPKKARKIFSL